jgi:phospholipid/cholesterol/gamma-HCH transport system substrate-binding protein
MRRRDEVLVGVFTTVAVVVAALSSVWLIRGGLEAGYPLYSRFQWGAGLKQGQPVWLVGVTVGFVDNVAYDPRGTLVVTYRIEKEYQVPKTTMATIVPNGFFGDQAIALTPSAPSTESFAPGDTVPVGISVSGLAALTARADTLSAGLTAILGAARVQMVDSGGLADLRRTMVTANRFFAELGDIAAIQSRELQSTLATLRSRVAAVDSQQIDSTLRAFNATSASLARVTSDLRVTMDRLNGVMTRVESGTGSLSKLLNDPALYDDARRLIGRIDSLVAAIARNPRKFLSFTVF